MNTDRLGASYPGGEKCRFLVWAPRAEKVAVKFVSPRGRIVPLKKADGGYHHAVIDGVSPGSRYFYLLDGEKERPDPASRFQPEGVHGPSEVVDPAAFRWTDSSWGGLPLTKYVIYEVHTGTFTPEGTFDAIIPRLGELKELGITALELMPVAQFPGNRNWGYDGVYPYAVQESYGGPAGLRRLVDACHRAGLAIILDVVYNHLGPEGNYCADFGPYFTERYHTPWGAALNFDGAGSDDVRRFFIENALYWMTEFHIDALRLDALHAILDISSYPFLKELATTFQVEVAKSGRRAYLIGESAANDVRLLQPRELGGYALDAQWNDDFHHALRVLLTGERQGYYQDFGSLAQLARAYRDGFVYSGEYSPYRQCRHGTSSRGVPAHRFVVFAQNHDQVGNRLRGDRLSESLPPAALRLAAGAVLLSPFVPLLFMGEEYGETAPFPYFVSHSNPELIAAVRRGRREEFAAFNWQGEIPDPQDEATFLGAKLRFHLKKEAPHRTLYEFYRELLRLRREVPALAALSKDSLTVTTPGETALCLHRRQGESSVCILLNCGPREVRAALPLPPGRWHRLLDAADERWGGDGSRAPEEITASGKTAAVTLPAYALMVYAKET
ncbi:MAG: malto-oligosyltrehalose trehalohydrolase [Chloroflexota bacterium]